MRRGSEMDRALAKNIVKRTGMGGERAKVKGGRMARGWRGNKVRQKILGLWISVS